jgi:hypothetical protein
MNNRVGRTGAYITKNTKYFLFTISVILIILFGLLFCVNEINTSVDEYTAQLKNIAHVLSAGIPLEVIYMRKMIPLLRTLCIMKW